MNDSDRDTLEALLALLSRREDSEEVCNPYAGQSNVPTQADAGHGAPATVPLLNLRHYLEDLLTQPRIDLLLVGEAPGYLGCALTGIPFSSPALCAAAPTRQWRRIAPGLDLTDLPQTHERSASAIWHVLAGRSVNVCCWNAFPYHPCHANNRTSNRKPRVAEIVEGQQALRLVRSLCRDALCIAVGRSAEQVLKRLALPSGSWHAVRHPSFGGQARFRQQMSHLLMDWPVREDHE